jgi:8-oxo-dGTP pyrophosphatase MutT (NUDIX family)
VASPFEDSIRGQIRAEILSIDPLDELERLHINETLAWVNSGVGLFRTAKPATPPKHLVSYFAVVDHGYILLVDHKNAGLWLPTGGHVEPDEHPRATVVREIQEELGLTPANPIEAPLMITSATTVARTAGHIDVSLWYVVSGDRTQNLEYDRGEFNSINWFAFDAIPFQQSDPHMQRFIQKLTRKFSAS